MSLDNVLTVIRNQTVFSRPDQVYVIDVQSIGFGAFAHQLQQELEKFRGLQMLTFNGCGINSLNFFPQLPSLIRLDLIMNQITGPQLVHLQGCRHLQTIMLGGNLIANTDDLSVLKGLKQLLQLDFLSNPIQSEPGYRFKVFDMFPSLSVLDSLDKGGKDGYNATSMANTTARVPDNLFDKSVPVSTTSPASGVAGTLFGGVRFPTLSTHFVPPPKAPRKHPSLASGRGNKVGKAHKAVKLIGKGSRVSQRVGVIFPVGRIKRLLKQKEPHMRVGVKASIFTAAVLEYLAAQVLQLAGNVAKRNKKARITSKMIDEALKGDQEFNSAFSQTILIPREE